jgi:hypothetical protein
MYHVQNHRPNGVLIRLSRLKRSFSYSKEKKSNLIHHEKILMEMICAGTQGSGKVQVGVIAKP